MSYNDKLRCDNLTTNHEGATAWRMTPEWELYTTVATTMGTEDKYYEGGEVRIQRIADLVRKTDPVFVAQLAVYAREKMHLRSVPLLLLVELSLIHKGDSLVSRAVARTVQRADEIAELLMCYQWRTGKKHLEKMSHQLLKGLGEAFNRFDEYQLAKYNRTNRKVTLRDALLLVHPKPKDETQAMLFRKVLNDKLETPYTWETQLSGMGKHKYVSKAEKVEAKRETWRKLVASNRMGYMATLRNLRNMLETNLDAESMEKVCAFLSNTDAVHRSKQMPFRFLSAYLQLFDYSENWTNRFIRDALERTNNKRKSVEHMVSEMEKGYFRTWVHKIARFHISGNTLFDCAKIHGTLDYKPMKIHYRKRRWISKHISNPTRKQHDKMLKMSELLPQLIRREEQLQRKLEKRLSGTCPNREMVRQALEEAVRHTADNISGFTPDTRVLLASDTSGSMCQPVSDNSMVMCYHIGLLLSMLMKSRCPQAVTGMFGSVWKEYDMPSDNILHNTKRMIEHEGEVGYATNGHKVIDWLISTKRVMDKVMLFTDCQLWDSYWGGASLAKSWKKYKEIAPDAKLYIFDLAGYGQSPVSMKREDLFCIAGWSDKVFDILAALENGKNAIDEIRRIVV